MNKFEINQILNTLKPNNSIILYCALIMLIYMFIMLVKRQKLVQP